MAYSRRMLLLAGVASLVSGALAVALQPDIVKDEAVAPRKLHGKFLHITDLHPDQFYKVHTSTDEADACHQGHGAAGTYGAETSDCDSPFALINATFDWIGTHIKDDIDFVIWTGDSARHDSDELIPRSPAQVLGTNRMIASQFERVFADPKGHGLVVPVIPSFGNNDILPHNILLPGPNKWLRYYSDIWRPFIPEAQRHSFDFGGWFYVEVIPGKLAVFSLNTLYFFDRNAGVDDCAHPSEPGYKQMEWLRVQLQFMRSRGMKAILMGHVPPARTDSKMLWDETCWQKYTLWLKQYRDVVVGGLYGHMNIDHFLLQDTKDIDLELLAPLDGERDKKDKGHKKNHKKAHARVAMEDELTAQSTADYLQELRHDWSKLSKPTVISQEVDADDVDASKKKKKKGKRKPDPWAERYHVSFVSPSVVPNYFPTLRVFEYNISGLEHTAVWADAQSSTPLVFTEAEEQKVLDLRDDWDQADTKIDTGSEKRSHKDNKHASSKKGKKGKKPKDPNLILPEPPAKTSPPGPAYSLQPLTLTGFTQFFANLTHINNDMTSDKQPAGTEAEAELEPETWADYWLNRWRKGKHGGKQPKSPTPKPRTFRYEVEYTTFDDKIYKLADLTVRSFVELAYRIGRDDGMGKAKGEQVEELDENASETEEVEDETSDLDSDDEDDEVTTDGKKGKGKKGKKGKGHKGKHGKNNKAWLHFLDHAFVGTVDEKDLRDMA